MTEKKITYHQVVKYLKEVYYDYGRECELCDHWDIDIEKCKKGHRTKEIDLDYGPNHSCHIRKLNGCSDFKEYAPSDYEIACNEVSRSNSYWSVGMGLYRTPKPNPNDYDENGKALRRANK